MKNKRVFFCRKCDYSQPDEDWIAIEGKSSGLCIQCGRDTNAKMSFSEAVKRLPFRAVALAAARQVKAKARIG